jgi:hypothetical protein
VVLQENFKRFVNEIRSDVKAIFESSELASLPADDEFAPPPEDSNAVRCVCNTEFDEGTMVQCAKCGVWQHTWCVQWEGEEAQE